MDKRFEKRLMYAQNPRLRRHKHKKSPKFHRARSNVELFLQELEEDYNRYSNVKIVDNRSQRSKSISLATGAVELPVKFLGGLAASAVEDLMTAAERRRQKKERLEALEKRRKYYAADLARAKAQRQAITLAKKQISCKLPTVEELSEAYLRRRENEEWKLRFGSLMVDLEEHVSRTYLINGNKFTGSCGGVREWLKKNCKLLAEHYSTCLRYKRLAQDEPLIND